MSDFSKAEIILEFNKIKELLSSYAPTEYSKVLCRELHPSDDIFTVRGLQLETSDAKRLCEEKGMPPFGNVKNITDSLDRAVKGSSLPAGELLAIANVLTTARGMIDYINTNRTFESVLDERFGFLKTDKSLEDRINKVIVSVDIIADDASPELSDIRRKIRHTNNNIKESLSKYTQGHYSKYLQENIVTQRDGRYVVPVKSEYKNEIKGLVHDTSASGATLFIEPMAVVTANNTLRELQIKEQREIDRILAVLSNSCAQIADTIIYDYKTINELAVIFARAQFSFALNAVMPHLNENNRYSLVRARHPLLNKYKAVPIDVGVGGSYDTLVITGPNTGGKTVTLKTIGLLALMAQSGMHIPCNEESDICVFKNILCDIGDEQSIEQSLSTFSAHMVNIVEILSKAEEDTLVLFDELGAGTDPVEGAALAVSILEKVRSLGSLCVATTHYSELKVYALDTDGVCNASCEFDLETLRPTYKLITGTPGKSNAFAISKKLGLSDDIINNAQSVLSGDNKRFEYVIEKLEQTRIEMEKERDEARRLKSEYELFKKETELHIKSELEKAKKETEKAQQKAQSIVQSARASSDYIFKELDKIKKQKDEQGFGDALEKGRADIRRALRRADDKANPVVEVVSDYKLPRPLKKGDFVHIVNLDRDGIVSEVPKGNTVSVKIGNLTTKTSIKNIMLNEEAAIKIITKDNKTVEKNYYQKTVSSDFKPELDLRGMNGDEAWLVCDKYLDDAVIAGIKTVTLIHGKGTGKLKAALKPLLTRDKRVKNHREGMYGEGDGGVTVVELK